MWVEAIHGRMVINMEDIKILTLVIIWLCFTVIMLATALSYKLFKVLKKNHTAYYKSLGEPLAIAPINITEHTYTQLLKGALFLFLMTVRGLPKEFPKDIRLRKSTKAIRITSAILLVLYVVLAILVYILLASGSLS
jgi:hypothetical protein